MTDDGNVDAGGGDSVRVLTIRNKLGLHARPAAMLAKLAAKFDCEITLEKGPVSVSAKSLMGLLSLEASIGTEICARADGPDADEALDQQHNLFESSFDHDDLRAALELSGLRVVADREMRDHFSWVVAQKR